MAREKALTTRLREAEEQAGKLKAEVHRLEGVKDMYEREARAAALEIDSVHCALDAMFVPRTVKSGYSEKTMTIASRLFAWQAGAKVAPTREVE